MKIEVEWRTLDEMKPGEPIVLIGARPVMPGAGRMALNFAKAAVKAAKGAAAGRGISADSEMIERRRAICHSNECGFYVRETERCAHKNCGCFLKFKTYLSSQRCPDGRW